MYLENRILVGDKLFFHPISLFSQTKRLLLLSRYFHGNGSDELNYTSSFPTAKTQHATNILRNHFHFFLIPLV